MEISGKERVAWGKWNFSSNSREKLQLLKSHFESSSCSPTDCRNLNSNIWRLLLGEIVNKNGTSSTQDFSIHCASKDVTFTSVNDISTAELDKKKIEIDHSQNYHDLQDNKKEKFGLNLTKQVIDTDCHKELIVSDPLEEIKSGNGDEILEIVGDISELLKKGPVQGLTKKLEGKELGNVLKVLKDNLATEESVTNLILSVCSPLEEDLLEQSRWTPVLYQQIVLPEILDRNTPVPRSLSSAISQLASSFPDACVNFLCIPLLMSSFEQEEFSGLSQPVIEILIKIIEESLAPQQRILLFRSFFKGGVRREKSANQDNLFPILLMLAETPGAFIGVDSEFLLNLTDWLEISSQHHFANIKFAKLLVASLKGITQDANSRKEGNYLSPECALKLKNVTSQNKTFLKKIAEKTLNLIC